jgi:hypothetical protein
MVRYGATGSAAVQISTKFLSQIKDVTGGGKGESYQQIEITRP